MVLFAAVLFLVTVGLVSQMVPCLMGNGYDQGATLGLLSFASGCGIVGSHVWDVLDVKLTGSIDGAYGILIGTCVVATILAIIMDDKLIGKAG